MRRKTWKKKVLSFFLAVALILGSSGIVQAEEPETLQNEDTGYGMTVTLQIEGYGYTIEEGIKVEMPDQYKSFEEYGLDVKEPAEKGYTVLHVLAQYCEDIGGYEEAAGDLISCNNGFVNGLFGYLPEKSTLMFLLNRQSLNVGASQQKVANGDLVSVVDIWANDNWTIGGQYAWFSQSNLTVEAEDTFRMKLNTTPLMWGETARLGGATVQVFKDGVLVTSGVTDKNGNVALSIDTPGTYTVTAEREAKDYYEDDMSHPYDITTPHATVTVIEPLPVTDAEAVQAAKEALSLGDVSEVKENLSLPVKGNKQTSITWKSDKPEILSNAGVVTRPVGENASVKLTATIQRGEVSDTKVFDVTVVGYSLRLKSLTVKEGTLDFDPDKLNYTVYVPENTTTITIKAETEEDFLTIAWIKINGNYSFAGQEKIVFDQDKDTIIIPIEVTKGNGGTKSSVTTLTIKRAANKGEPLADLPNITWGQHLGEKNNNAVFATKTPTGEAELQWESFSNAPDFWGSVYAGTPILVNGHIYAVRNNKIEMLDANTGEVKASSELHAGIGYYSNIIYGGGMIFVPLGNGTIQCFNAATLKSMYLIASPASFGTSLSVNGAMHYDDGKLYVGYSDGAYVDPTGCYAAYDTIDLDVDNETELVTPLWKTENGQSYYGSGAVTIDGNVVIAGDSGVISVHNAYTGEKLSECQLDGAVRGSLVYAEGYIWTATQGKKIYKFALSDKGNLEMVKEASLPGITNASPVVTGGKVYITGGSFNDGGFFAVYDMDLRLLAKETTENLLNTPTVTTAYDDVYVYFTENGPEGSLYMAKVTANNKITLTKLYTPQHPQYCMSKVVVGADGTLYYGNDAGYLYAIHVKGQEKPIVPESPVTDDSNQNTVKLEPQKLTPTVRKLKVNASGKTKQSSSAGIAEAIVKSNEKKEKSLTVNNPPEVIEADVFETLAGYPDFRLILDCGNYTLSIKGSDITDTSAVLNTKLIELENTLSKKEASKYGNYQQLAFVQEGKLPGKVTVVYHLGKQFDKSLELYLYDMSNPEDATEVVLQDSYAMFTLEESGEFILSDSKAENAVEADLAEIEEELLPSEKEKTGIPVWAYLLIGIGVGAIFGGIITTKVVTARKKEDTWEK